MFLITTTVFHGKLLGELLRNLEFLPQVAASSDAQQGRLSAFHVHPSYLPGPSSEPLDPHSQWLCILDSEVGRLRKGGWTPAPFPFPLLAVSSVLDLLGYINWLLPHAGILPT